jgi:hypothetical protein
MGRGPPRDQKGGLSIVRSCIMQRRNGTDGVTTLRAQVQQINRDLERARTPELTRGRSMGPLLSLSSKELGHVVRNAQASLVGTPKFSGLPPAMPITSHQSIAIAKSQATHLFLTQAQSNSLRAYKYIPLAECNGFRVVPDRRSTHTCHILNYYEEFRAAKERRMAEIKARFRQPPRPFALLALHRHPRDGSSSLPKLR